jgi:hypothetical protein
MPKLTIAGIVMLLLFTPKAWGQNLKPERDKLEFLIGRPRHYSRASKGNREPRFTSTVRPE